MGIASVPSRGLCFQSSINYIISCISCFVSVPSRGLCFQSPNYCSRSSRRRKSFRPLSGIMFSIGYVGIVWYEELEFPSPLGDYVFNRAILSRFGKPISGVSVPSRGLCFQSRDWEMMSIGERVSVPSRGLCFQSHGTYLPIRPNV